MSIQFLPTEINSQVTKFASKHNLSEDDILSLMRRLRKVSLKAMEDELKELDK